MHRRKIITGATVITAITGILLGGFTYRVMGRAMSPIQLVKGSTIGTPVFSDGDTINGGQGNDVDSIPAGDFPDHYHIHVHLSLIVDGRQIAIPKAIGVVDAHIRAPGFVDSDELYWLHTHDATGIIHIEAPVQRQFTLQNFFDVWGEPLNRDDVAGFKGDVHAYINGIPFSGELGSIALMPHEEITLEIGRPTIAPPKYSFPKGY